jgi:hypothetical protein
MSFRLEALNRSISVASSWQGQQAASATTLLRWHDDEHRDGALRIVTSAQRLVRESAVDQRFLQLDRRVRVPQAARARLAERASAIAPLCGPL